jgi:hypothetical protein
MKVLTESVPLDIKHISYVVKDINITAHHFNVHTGFCLFSNTLFLT